MLVKEFESILKFVQKCSHLNVVLQGLLKPYHLMIGCQNCYNLSHSCLINEPVHEIMVLITQATSEGSGEPTHPEPSLFAHMKYESRRRVHQKPDI